MNNKTPISLWALCATLLLAVLVLQIQQQGRLRALQRQQETRLAQGEQQAKAQQDALRNLSDRVLSLGTNWEAELTPRLNAKADEVVTAFSKRLNEKATEAATQVSNVIRRQAESAVTASATEQSNKTARLLEAANRYEKESRPELTELCYLTAFKCSDGNAGLVLKPFLAWQERNFDTLSEHDVLTSGATKLMALYEALDKALPESIASPGDMEVALFAVEKIRARITERQQATIANVRKVLSWDQFKATNSPIYAQFNETLISFAPVNQTLEEERNELLQTVDNLIQTATALTPVSVADLLPPSPKTPIQLLTIWFDRGVELVDSPTNTLEARLAGLSVLMDFAQQQGKQAECSRYAEVLTNKFVVLACAQWAGRAQEYGPLTDKRDYPDAETIALGQSLLNQGFSILKSLPVKSLTAEVAAELPRLASKIALQRELFLVSQVRLAEATTAFSSKEQAARTRGLLYGQIMSALFDLRNLQKEVEKECGTVAEALGTLRDVEGRFREYLAAYEKFDKADMEDAKADQLAKLRQQYQRYADYCEQKIQDAQSDYDSGKKIADEWFSVWSNEEAQVKLEKGLKKLYSTDINDLNRADPGLANKWSTVEELLKKEFKKKPSEVNAQTEKKSLIDF